MASNERRLDNEHKMSYSANISSISRLRLETDGDGVRTLVCLNGCPLKCKMCPNKDLLEKGSPFWYTPESLLESLKIDDVYYRASYGGITFGGGEPALESEFIASFSRMCPKEWTVYIETSLNVDQDHIDVLAHVIDHWYIDIKDINDKIYHKYTGHSNSQVLSNLQRLIDRGLASKITVRIPHIPGYNTPEDVKKSEDFIRSLGLEDIDIFHYQEQHDSDPPLMGVPVFYENYPWWVRVLRTVTAILAVIGSGLICFKLISSTVGAIITASLVSIIVLFIVILLWDDIGGFIRGRSVNNVIDKLEDDEWNKKV